MTQSIDSDDNSNAKVDSRKRSCKSNITPKVIQDTLDAGGSLVPMPINLKLSSLYNILKVCLNCFSNMFKHILGQRRKRSGVDLY